MPRDKSNKYRKSSKISVPLSLSLSSSSPTAAPNLCSDEQVSEWTNEALASLIYTILQVQIEVSFHLQDRLLILGGYNHFNILLGLFSIY